MTPNIVNPDKIPKLTPNMQELVAKQKELDEQIKSAKGLDKLKLNIKKAKVTMEMSKHDFKTY